MKVAASVKKRCAKCKRTRRGGRIVITCENPRHKARQKGLALRKKAA